MRDSNGASLVDTVLREKAREAIKAGKLPSRSADRIVGGSGSGLVCPVCGEPVMRHMTELELEFNRNGTLAPRTVRLHHRCFAAWEMERTALLTLDSAADTSR